MRNPEVHDLAVKIRRHDDVAGLDVAVDDALGVRECESREDVVRYLKRSSKR